jgi:MerR family transcriptional regulator, light-induced transcriptional regulator
MACYRDMADYSIKDLENFTNIKAHTLRIWEQRYNLLEPRRTSTNIRYYSDRDLKKILNINLLYSNGHKISKIAKLSEEEITELAAQILLAGTENPIDQVEHFVKYILELNESAINKKLDELNHEYGMQDMYTRFMIPLLRKIGDLWQIDAISVSHEHFFSNILRDFFIRETAKIPTPKKSSGRVILFLHEREMHELSLLYYHHLLKTRGYECFYLGQNVPMKDLKVMVAQLKPDYLFTSVIAETDRAFFAEFISELCSFVAPRKIYMGGYQLNKYIDLLPEAIRQIQSESDIDL